jgi:hypothetical protein
MFITIETLFGCRQVIWCGEARHIEDAEGQTYLDFDPTPSLFV